MSKGRRILKDQRLLLLIIIVVLSATVGIINPRFVRLNNIMNPEFTIERDEKQIALGPFPPESVVRSVFITTGTSETRIKILAFG